MFENKSYFIVQNKFWLVFVKPLINILSSVVILLLFFLIVTPIGIIMRLLGKDLIGLKLNKSAKIITRASNDVSDFCLKSSRLAAGHPEGFFEAFSNIYTEFADCILSNNKTNHTFPNIEDGVKGIKFIFAAKKSSNQNSKWIKI